MNNISKFPLQPIILLNKIARAKIASNNHLNFIYDNQDSCYGKDDIGI